jgi:glyoxylase-like metal-dependent hydrolase (beta-lactamase superfamily II)
MAGESIRVGDVEIVSLTDGGNEAALADFFPHHGPEDWTAFPDYVDEHGKYRTPVNLGVYLIIANDYKVLVDTGVGPVPFAPYPDLTGNLVPTMREQCGFGPEDVDMVFATHMHFDHIGWHVTNVNGRPEATFENAKYAVPRGDWNAIFDPEIAKTKGPHSHDYSQDAADIFDLSRPVAEDLLRAVDVMPVNGEHSLTDEIVTVDTPGHTPGHQSLMISSGRERVFLMGDAIHLPVQVEVPDRVVGADVHPQLAVKTRIETLDWLEREGLMTVVGHFPAPGFGHIVRGEDKRYWRGV